MMASAKRRASLRLVESISLGATYRLEYRPMGGDTLGFGVRSASTSCTRVPALMTVGTPIPTTGTPMVRKESS